MTEKDNRIETAFSPEAFRKSGHQLIDFLADQLGDSMAAKNSQTIAYLDPEQAYEKISRWAQQAVSATADPADWSHRVDPAELFEQVYQDCIRLHDPRFMGHQIMPPVPVAALAGLFTDFVNNGMGVYEMGIAGTAIERWVVKQTAQRMGFSSDADGVMTCGGSLANLTALLAARSHCGTEKIWSRGDRSEKLAVMISQQSHYCVDRAAKIMGWGDDGIIKIPVNDRYQMQTDRLQPAYQAAIDRGVRPIAVVGSACSTSTGSFDDLRSIGEFCQNNRLWFHVDGAHGVANVFSQRHRSLVDGIELADSVALDFHKMLMTPAVCSALIFRDGKQSYGSFAQQADYLWADSESAEWFNLARRTFECTKTMLGLKVFSIIVTHGWQLLEQNIERLNQSAATFAEQIDSADDFELAVWPETNIVCFRYRGTGDDPNQNPCETNQQIRQKIIERGEYYIVQTSLEGKTWLRTTLSNPFTSPHEMQKLLDLIRALALEQG